MTTTVKTDELKGTLDQHLTGIFKALNAMGSEQPNGMLMITDENKDEIMAKAFEMMRAENSQVQNSEPRELTLAEIWSEQWDEFYAEQVDLILENESLSTEETKARITFLAYVDKNMNNIIADFVEISNIFSKFYTAQIALIGLQHYLSDDYKFQKDIYGGSMGIIKNLADNIRILFQPSARAYQMGAQCIVLGDGWNFIIDLYEFHPREISFEFFVYC